MTSLIPRTRTMFPGLTELFDVAWPFGEHNLVRIEELAEDGKYVIRAELPGFDPEKGVHIAATYTDGILEVTVPFETHEAAKQVEIPIKKN